LQAAVMLKMVCELCIHMYSLIHLQI
jgi:hypothetical protein